MADQTLTVGEDEAREARKAAAWDAEHREGMSYGDTRDMLRNALGAKFATGEDEWVYLEDFGDDWVVYELKSEIFRCSYSIDGDEVTLGTPETVTTKTTYEPMQTNSASVELELREEGESTATTLTHTAAGDALTPVTVVRRRKERRRQVPLTPEVRHWQAEGLEVRSSKTTDEIIITGTPIVYNAPYTVTDMFGEFTERMLPGVCSGVLERGADVRFLFNHDGLPLARTTSGTLKLEDSPTALQMVATLDARQQLANDLAIATERGDISQMSIGFVIARDAWDEAMEERDVILFDDLLDVSSVTYPASPTTATQVAQRMLMMAPIESRARARRIYADLRAGQALSESEQRFMAAGFAGLDGLEEDEPADLIDASEKTAPARDGTRSSTKASTLRLQLEARATKRKRQKKIAA
jgi:HK97 family phage prohead protease